MTREKALEASKALDNIDGFEFLMEKIDQAIAETEDYIFLSQDFKLELDNLLQAELLRLKNVLEEM
jgi:hypothetical protein